MVALTTPFYKKLAYILICIIAIGYLVILGKELLSPLIFSILFSIVLLPVANALERRLRLPRSMAALASLLLFITSIALIVYFVGSQLTNLASDWPKFQEQLRASIDSLQNWIALKYNINANKQLTYWHNATTNMINSGTAFLGTTVLSVSSILLFLIFTLIDIFFLLLYRRLILKFLVSVFKEEHSKVVNSIVEQVQLIIRKYVLGLLLEMTIVSTVCCIAFWALGIKYAVLLGLLTGLLNLIPYIGIFTALVLSLLITFATSVATKILLVLIVIVSMHLIDSNILLPLIVGSKVKINAMITVSGVVIGEMIWGIPGMFLSIPVIAVLKIIFDRVETLQPWGMLLGEEAKDNPKTVARKKTYKIM